jgi:hypothetical protein
MYVACKLCGGWFNATPEPDARSVDCAHCRAPITLRASLVPSGTFATAQRDRAEFRSLLAAQQAVLDKRAKPETQGASNDVDTFGRPYRHRR